MRKKREGERKKRKKRENIERNGRISVLNRQLLL